MNRLMSLLFFRPARPAGQLRSTDGSGEAVEGNSAAATRQQVLQVALRSVLRRQGLPPEWVDCENARVSRRATKPGIFMRLSLRHWDARLMQYLPALEQELNKEVLRFDAAAATWLLGITWQLKLKGQLPPATLPAPDFWLQEPVVGTATPPAATAVGEPAGQAETAPVAAVPAQRPRLRERKAPVTASPVPAALPSSEAKLKADLARLFSLRDEEIERNAFKGLMPAGYEETQPGALT